MKYIIISYLCMTVVLVIAVVNIAVGGSWTLAAIQTIFLSAQFIFVYLGLKRI